MGLTVSKWGNSLGIRIPAAIVEALSIHSGDVIDYELKGDNVIFSKKKTTAQLFEDFYGKSFSDITASDLGATDEIDFGEDVGNEVF